MPKGPLLRFKVVELKHKLVALIPLLIDHRSITHCFCFCIKLHVDWSFSAHLKLATLRLEQILSSSGLC